MAADINGQIREWLDTPVSDRNLKSGADLLLQLTGSKVQYDAVCRNLAKHASFIETRLQKLLQFRLAKLTHREFRKMESEAKAALDRHFDKLPPDPNSPSRRGKRPDHDQLPHEIRELFENNMDARRKMAECHMQLRRLSGPALTCPDSDRYPFVKELIRLDKESLERWRRYDSYILN